MRPTTAHTGDVIEFGVRLRNWQFEHPDGVLSDRSLTKQEKRELLASWASDAFAVPSRPALRAPAALKAPVTIDEILRALSDLDEQDPRHPPGGIPKRLRTIDRALAA